MNGMTKHVVVGEAVALVAWLIVMLACQNVLMSPFVFYTSLLFGFSPLWCLPSPWRWQTAREGLVP